MKIIALLCTVLMLTSCAGQDCLKRTAALEIAITEGYASTGRLLGSGMIDKATARKSLLAVDSANVLVDRAGELCRVDDPAARDYLQQAGLLIFDVHVLLGEET